MIIFNTQVAAEWVDYNGHMNDAEYARVFSLAVEALMDHIGLDESGRADYGYTIYTLETHLCYQRETHQGEPLVVSLALLDSDTKRLHVFLSCMTAKGKD
ncbi:thioesterase family protein [Vreelandella azerica]|uniref:thioesterase family protein n=1 Tax=Vreelandella azerica TaxID=2732867 RepID=UPI002E2858E0|nr:thioesterase family protein [Halomonas azerica]